MRDLAGLENAFVFCSIGYQLGQTVLWLLVAFEYFGASEWQSSHYAFDQLTTGEIARRKQEKYTSNIDDDYDGDGNDNDDNDKINKLEHRQIRRARPFCIFALYIYNVRAQCVLVRIVRARTRLYVLYCLAVRSM